MHTRMADFIHCVADRIIVGSCTLVTFIWGEVMPPLFNKEGALHMFSLAPLLSHLTKKRGKGNLFVLFSPLHLIKGGKPFVLGPTSCSWIGPLTSLNKSGLCYNWYSILTLISFFLSMNRSPYPQMKGYMCYTLPVLQWVLLPSNKGACYPFPIRQWVPLPLNEEKLHMLYIVLYLSNWYSILTLINPVCE